MWLLTFLSFCVFNSLHISSVSLLCLNFLIIFLSFSRNPFYTSCLTIDCSDFYYTNHNNTFTQCTNIPQHSLKFKLKAPELSWWTPWIRHQDCDALLEEAARNFFPPVFPMHIQCISTCTTSLALLGHRYLLLCLCLPHCWHTTTLQKHLWRAWTSGFSRACCSWNQASSCQSWVLLQCFGIFFFFWATSKPYLKNQTILTRACLFWANSCPHQSSIKNRQQKCKYVFLSDRNIFPSYPQLWDGPSVRYRDTL